MIPHVEPMKTPDGEAFWEGCKNEQLLIPKCSDCEQYHFYPRILCPNCWSENIQFEHVSGQGILYSYTTIYPKPPAQPYIVALIELDEGVRLMSNLLNESKRALQVGQKVHVTFTQLAESETKLPQFVVSEV
jgi:uncharacterized protein